MSTFRKAMMAVNHIGSRPDGSDWRLGIRSPFGEGTLGVLTVSDKAVVTSGSYKRYFVGEDGKEYGHIIDPSTGYPADNDLAAVIIIAAEGKQGDALSTAMYVKGLDGAENYWQANQEEEKGMIKFMKTWMITGCSSGLGRSLARAALEEGYHVVVTARNAEKLKDFQEKFPETALVLSLDVTDDESVKRAVSTAKERFGMIDVLVNNAGYGYHAAVGFADQTMKNRGKEYDKWREFSCQLDYQEG